MKIKNILLISILGASLGLGSCKALARTASKYWTKKQIKEFVKNCEEKSSKIIGEDKAHKFCDCAVDQVAKQYKKYEEAKTVSIMKIVKIANDCR